MNKKYPLLAYTEHPRIGEPAYFLIKSKDELFELSINIFEAYDTETNLFEFISKKPDIDKYPEISNELIEMAPDDDIKIILERKRDDRNHWLSDTLNLNNLVWNYKTYEYLYNLYTSASNGKGESAYLLLTHLEHLVLKEFIDIYDF